LHVHVIVECRGVVLEVSGAGLVERVFRLGAAENGNCDCGHQDSDDE
jgi:hypothetical protein